jgi:hypothetical protein
MVNFEQLMHVMEKSHFPITVNLVHNDGDKPFIRINSGKYTDNGNIRADFDVEDFDAILRLNNIIGKGSILERQQQKQKDAILSGGYPKREDMIMEDYVYDVLAKYVTQMLQAAMGKNFFPDIKYLPKHKTYFEFEVLQ